MKSKVCYISNSCFFDVDLNIIRGLQEYYDVYWCVFIPSVSPVYSENFFKNFVSGTGIHLSVYKCGNKFYNRWKLNLVHFLVKMYFLNPEIVYACLYNRFFFNCIGFVFKKNRIVLGIHDVEPHSTNSRGDEIKRLYNYAVKKFSYFVQFSSNQYELFETKFPKKKHFLVHLTNKNFGRPSVTHFFNPSRICLLYWGGIFDYYKGFDLLIDAFERFLANGGDNITLTICGRFEKNSYERKRVFNNKIRTRSKYNFIIRYISDEEVPNIFASHDFVVYPYRDATQSGALMVATQYVKPVIAASHSCFSEIYSNGENSILYSPNDSDGLYNAICYLSKMKVEEYNRYVDSCKCIKERFSECVVAREYSIAFDNIINGQNAKL